MSEMPERIWANPDAGYCTTVGPNTYTTEYIRADRATLSSVAVAEREPVAWPTERVNIPEPGNHECRIVGFRIREGDEAWGAHGLSEPFFWLERMCQPTSELEAENARLRGERDEYRRKWEQACSMGHLQAEAAEARLAEALKALERHEQGWANVLELDLLPPQHRDTAEELRSHARRVCEGGKVDG